MSQHEILTIQYMSTIFVSEAASQAVRILMLPQYGIIFDAELQTAQWHNMLGCRTRVLFV